MDALLDKDICIPEKSYNARARINIIGGRYRWPSPRGVSLVGSRQL